MTNSQPASAPTLPEDERWTQRRADARRNHERIIAAALEVFAERGLDATVPEVAKRAGVGKATVYRSYPTKADLIEAIANYQLSWMQERITQATKEPDPYAALASFLGDLAERLAGDRVLADVVPEVTRGRGDLVMTELGALIEAAKDEERIRPDVTLEDLRILLGGAIRQLVAMDIRDPARWRRYVDFVLAALSN